MDNTAAVERSLTARRSRSERLQLVGPGTPMGAYLRCFWYPIAALAELDEWPVKKIRLLGEDLALFRGDDGTLGLVADRCPHRGASLSCGMPDGPHLRCAYHGWAYDTTGQCVDTPAEPATSTLKDRIAIAGYPVSALGGMAWAYLGKQPAPLLPRFEHIVRDDLEKSLAFTLIPCNWLQIAENNVDPLHLEYLHMRFLNWERARRGEPPIGVRKHARIDFEVFEFGILKKRMWEGDTEDTEEWRVGHPMFFPGNHLFTMDGGKRVQYQYRVPVDNTNTLVYWYDAKELGPGETATAIPSPIANPPRTPDGKFMPGTVNGQDMMVEITQGPMTDHSLEHLGESDRGVALFRRTLLEQVERVERGEDPIGVVRDPAKNTPFIRLPTEQSLGYEMSGVLNSVTTGYYYP
jgi:5,5'-dehydrodivanillate O-demethylase oxygenase subunit